MFRITRPEKISVKVGVKVPGTRETQKFTAHFAYLDLQERKAFVERITAYERMDDTAIMKELLLGWDDVQRENGEALKHSEAAIEMLMNIPHVADALFRAVMSDVLGGAIARKN